MTYRQFRNWCNDRAADGCWGFKEASLCCYVITEIQKLPFWKREKAWSGEEKFLVNNIINPINEMIEKVNKANEIIEKENQKLKEERDNGTD